MRGGIKQWAGIMGIMGVSGSVVGMAASPTLALQRGGKGAVTLNCAVDLRRRAVLETSSDLRDWRARYAFNTGRNGNVIHFPAAAAAAFYRLRLANFPLPAGLVWISPGSFLMGSGEYEEGREADEGPRREVRIDKGFWMGRTEVTVKQFVSVMHYNPTMEDTASFLPVNRVSLTEAKQYCQRLTATQRKRGVIPPGTAYRLPSEAEWEYACRAGTQTRFNFGDDPEYQKISAHAWCRLNTARPMPVGGKLPNAWGLYDMHGNVFEWCLGWYTPYPHGVRFGYDKIRNYRGGSFYCPLEYLRSASRHPGKEEHSELIGFRVVLGADSETVLPLNEVAPPKAAIEWAADGTWARVSGASATPESGVRYSTHTWLPTLRSPAQPPLLTAPGVVKMIAFRENFTCSKAVEVVIQQVAPPEALRANGTLLIKAVPAGIPEYALADGVWHAYTRPVTVPAESAVSVRIRRPGWLTSPVVTLL